MKPTILICLLLSSIILNSCKKDEEFLRNSDLMVVNAAVDLASVKVNLQNSPIIFATALQVNFGSGTFFYDRYGTTNLKLVSSVDTTASLFNGNLDLLTPVSTVYLIGQSPNIETIFKNETNFPFVPTDIITPDSVINIRFANFSPNSQAVNIKIPTVPTAEAINLAFKDITEFKAYPAKTTNGSYVFEVRDSQTNTLLFTYSFTVTATNRFKNVLLMLKGLKGTTTGTNAFSITPINYF